MNVLIWYKRDLRCQHHPALQAGHDMGRVLPLYIVEPDYWQLPDTSARQWDFTAECLTELRDDLAALGAPLIVRTGDAVAHLDRLCRQHHIARIISHQETGNAWCAARDRRVADWCQSAGIEWTVLPQPGATERLTDDSLGATVTHLNPVTGPEPGPIPSAKSLKMLSDTCPHRQVGGRSQALQHLQSFVQLRSDTYRPGAASPLTAERACSRLSAHLALGTVSMEEVAQAARLRQAEAPGKLWHSALAKFQRQLDRRDHFLALPEVSATVYAQRPPTAPNMGFLNERSDGYAAWRAGQTGLPYLDACMRYLSATGWLNAGSRAMVLRAAMGGLGISAYDAGMHLARSATDYDPRLHWAQVLAISEHSAHPTTGAAHPVACGMKDDPKGAFMRRWLPELALVPEPFIHQPWKWPGFHAHAARRYPAPFVQFANAALGLRRAPPDLQRAAHSRDFAQRHAAGKPAAARQLALDF